MTELLNSGMSDAAKTVLQVFGFDVEIVIVPI